MDHYQTLGVPRDASLEAIRSAFRELSRRHHPDTAGKGETAKFQAVKAAYDVLRDAKERAKYDEQLAETPQIATPHFMWSNIAQGKGKTGKGKGHARIQEDRPDLDVMIDAYFGRWNDPE